MSAGVSFAGYGNHFNNQTFNAISVTVHTISAGKPVFWTGRIAHGSSDQQNSTITILLNARGTA